MSTPNTLSAKGKGFRQKADPRDGNYPLSMLMKGMSRRKMTQRFYKIGPIMDQGNTSSCVGHGCKLLLTSDPFAQATPNLSPFDIYDEARKIDEFDTGEDGGTSVRAGLNVLKNKGLIVAYHWATSVEQVVDYLLRVSPLVVGTQWLSGMGVLDGNGVGSLSGYNEGGHCYFACGVDLTEGTILFANSWGQSFGFGGLFSLRINDFGNLLYNGGCAAAVREK